jgi:YesN/AraC family two-component response regulator
MEVVENEVRLNHILIPTEPKHLNDDLLSQLNHLVHAEKVYLDPNLSLVNLAQKLDTNRTHLSQVFNEHHKVSFNDYINELRVKETCRLLMAITDKNVTIDRILSNSGFSSRTPFYNSFKKFTGVTPEEFKRMNPSQN